MQAIPYAIFLLIEDDVRETENEHLEALFVEAFGDRQSFFNICIKPPVLAGLTDFRDFGFAIFATLALFIPTFGTLRMTGTDLIVFGIVMLLVTG